MKYLHDGREVSQALEAMAPEFRVELAKYLRPDAAEWVELIFVFKSGTGQHINNFGLGRALAG